MAKNAEFAALFKASGWTQAEVARRLKVERGTVSRYLTDDPENQIAAPEPMVELFKFVLASEKPEALTASRTLAAHMLEEYQVMKDAPGEMDFALWRRRAKEAEGKLARMREGLRGLLNETTEAPAPVPDETLVHETGRKRAAEVSSGLTPEEARLLAEPAAPDDGADRGGAGTESGRRPGVDERTSRKDEQSGASSNQAKSRRGPGSTKESQK